MTESSRGCILFATMEFHPTNVGGAGTFIHHAAQLLVERGFTVVLLYDHGRDEFEQLVTVDRLGIPFGHRLLVYLLDDLCQDMPVHPEPCADIAIAKSLRLNHALHKLTEMHEIDLIELYDFCAHGFHYLAQPAEDRPSVAVRVHSTIELMERRTRAPLLPGRVWLYAMERAQLTLADLVLLPGKVFYEEEIRPLYPTMSPDRVMISPPVHVPIGEVEYDPDARNIVFYGRLSTMKGLDTFLRAGILALEDPVFADWLDKFVIIGPEDYVATALTTREMRALIPKNRFDRFDFTGRLDHTGLLEKLRTTAFACFANRVESFCYAAHELHTAGVPLVVNRIPAFEDGFEDGVSAIFFDGTAFDLAARMTALARDAALRIKLSRYGKERITSYWVDHYTAHLAHLRQLRTRAKRAPLSGSAIVLSAGDREAVERTVASLASLPLRPVVLELDPAGELRFAGSRWRGAPQDASGSVPLGLQPVGATCLFVRAGDIVMPQWADKALRVLAQNSRVGAVGGWVRQPADLRSMAYLYIPELACADEPGLRVLLRVDAGQTVGEYLYGWSNQSERSYLLAHRAAGRVSVELPELAVDACGAVELPAIPTTEDGVDFDRFSREFLAVTQQPTAPTTGTHFNLVHGDPDVLATTLIPSLVVIRLAKGSVGKLSVLRLLRDDHFLECDWSAVANSEGSAGPAEVETPGGVQVTQKGSMRFHAHGRTGVDLLMGPSAGACEIIHRGRVDCIDLKQPETQSCRVWLDELDGGHRPRPDGGVRSYWPTPAVPLKPAHAVLKSSNIALAIVAPPAESGVAAMLRFRSGCGALTPEELGLVVDEEPTRNVAYALKAIQHSGCRRVAIDASVPSGAELADRLLDGDDDRQIIVLVGERPPPGISDVIADYRDLGQWLRLASRYPTRLAAAGNSQGLIGLFSRCGIRTVSVPVRLPALRAVEAGDDGEVEVVVTAGTGSVARVELDPAIAWLKSNTMHMIMAVAHALRQGLGISCLWLPADDELGARVAKTFVAAPRVEHYEEPDAAYCGDPRRRVALAVFPNDAELPDAAATALGWGALPILGPSGVFARHTGLRDALCVPYWEDSIAIADALTRTVERFDRLATEYDRFRLAQDELIERELAALISGPLERTHPDLLQPAVNDSV